jgi:hypothetical protein
MLWTYASCGEAILIWGLVHFGGKSGRSIWAGSVLRIHCMSEFNRHRQTDGDMKRAKLGLLEVLGLLVRMPGEGDVTALPLFRGAEDSSLFYFWREESVRFCYFLVGGRRRCFLWVDFTLFLVGRRLGSVSRGQLLRSVFLVGSCWGIVSHRQLLRSAFCRRLRSGRCMAQIFLSSTCNRGDIRQIDRTLMGSGL